MNRSMHHLNIDFIKPLLVLLIAHTVTLSNVTDGVKLLTAVVALTYGAVKLYKELKK